MPPTRFSPEINRLRAALRGKTGTTLLTALRRHIELIPAPVLVADNSSRYVAANDAARQLTGYSQNELMTMTVADLTPLPKAAAGQRMWEHFISHGAQRGDYVLQRKHGGTVHVRYWAFASIAPGLHVSVLVPQNVTTPEP